MIVFLYGDNIYGSRKNLEEIVAKYKEKHEESVNFFEFNLDDGGDWDKLRSAIQTMPLFVEKKLIVIKEVFASKRVDDFKDLIEQNKLVENGDVFLVVWERLNGAELKSASFLLKDKNVKQKEFTLPKGRKLEIWTEKEFTDRGVGIEKSALNRLVTYTNGDILRLAGEIDKLASFKGQGIVNEKDIDQLVIPDMEQNVFALTDAILANNKDKALTVLENFLNKTTDRTIVINMLAVVVAQFRNLIIIKDLMDRGTSVPQIASKAGIHPFVVKKSIPALHRFDAERLKKLYEKLLSLDIALKSKNLNPLLLLDMFIFSV
jgi:DNA polymerase-3 subunit delta